MVVLVQARPKIRTPFDYRRRAVFTIGSNSASPIYGIFIAFFTPNWKPSELINFWLPCLPPWFTLWNVGGIWEVNGTAATVCESTTAPVLRQVEANEGDLAGKISPKPRMPDSNGTQTYEKYKN